MPPSFTLTRAVLDSVARIERSLGRLEGRAVERPQPKLRKRNRVRTVHASAAIEGNPLTEAQVTALLDGRRVLGAEKDVREILNVNEAYARLERWKAGNVRSLLAAHGVLMAGLMPNEGRFRASGVGVFRGEKLAHLAPPAHLVDAQVRALLRWVSRTDTPTLVAGCVAHYELLFIHPFLDGNGRLARLWQQVIHHGHSPLLQYVPVEAVIRERQRDYYRALRFSDQHGDCTRFLELSLSLLSDALTTFVKEARPDAETPERRLTRAQTAFPNRWFSRAAYLALHPRISTATASRDLAQGVMGRRLETRGERRFTEYRFHARSGK